MKPLLRRHPPSREPQSAQAVPRSETSWAADGLCPPTSRGAAVLGRLGRPCSNTGLNPGCDPYFFGPGDQTTSVGPRDLDLFRQTAPEVMLALAACSAVGLAAGCEAGLLGWRKITSAVPSTNLRRQLVQPRHDPVAEPSSIAAPIGELMSSPQATTPKSSPSSSAPASTPTLSEATKAGCSSSSLWSGLTGS